MVELIVSGHIRILQINEIDRDAIGFDDSWREGRTLIRTDADALTRARLVLVQATATVIASGLKVFGVTPVEEMR